ncbi:MAG: RagB/SusD family nutrient uptake outer membrane protein [Candidatus Azobacteroides sp.]|nr:RagB/SusD family nutrient uptake outer membrane protein [Candidatus Azobacteroides sp.]
MKKNRLSGAFIALAATILLFSCNDSNDDNIVGGGNVVQSDAEALALVNGAYGPYQTLSSTFTSLIETPTDGTISYLGDEDGDAPKASRIEIDYTNTYPVKTFNALYQSIGIVNDAIEKVNASDAVSESTKRLATARAKFLRGLFYSYLVQLFGEIPLSLQTDVVVKERSSIDDVYTQIVKDLTEAEADLPEYDSNPVVPSKGAANSLLSRVYLAWGHNPLTQAQVEAIANSKTDPVPSVDNGKLTKAIEYADKVINSGRYSLLSNFSDLFGLANESRTPEHIFTIQHEGDGIDAQGNHQYHCAFTFPFKVEKETHIQPSHIFEFWPDSDPRKEFSITTKLANPEEDNKVYEYLPPVTLPRYGKGIDRSYYNSVNITILNNDVDRIEIRYAEVLLNKAEALFFLGRTSEALTLINQIRERAYGSHFEHGGRLTTLTANDLYNEWEFEFVYEQKQWLNFTRWKTLIKSIQRVQDFEHFDESYSTVGNIGRDGSTVNAFFVRVHKHLRAKYENVTGKHYRFPIPTGTQGEDLGIVPQNPGY